MSLACDAIALGSNQVEVQIICYWPQIWTHSVEIVRMLRYSVDEENVAGQEIEARKTGITVYV
jgi:hypothetical protein